MDWNDAGIDERVGVITIESFLVDLDLYSLEFSPIQEQSPPEANIGKNFVHYKRNLAQSMGRQVRLFTTINGLRCYLTTNRAHNSRIALVPTMGALHEGHLSLIQRARHELDRSEDRVIVSIFVNPIQFAPGEDFQQYPRPLEQDLALCQAAGVDGVFVPPAAELYPAGQEMITQVMPPASMIAGLCGRSRPTHFQGVATVVTKLLQIVQPDRAYFGQKDAQQLAILRKMTADLNLPVEIIGCPIVREANGLAMSSRNQYLTDQQRSQAAILYRSLQSAARAVASGTTLATEIISTVKTELEQMPAMKPEYVELVHPETLMPLEQLEDAGLLAIAARLGNTRLIDNVLLQTRQPILAIDGPAGAGKSTVVRRVAQELGLLYLDTGAMYRAVTWLTLQSGIAIDDEAAIAELVSQCELEISGDPAAVSVRIDGQDVTQAIRSLEVTAQVSAIAAQPFVRRELTQRQQAYGRKGGVVMDGRDIGTHVFPDAELKIFLTASVQERARRRLHDLQAQGQAMSLEALEQSIAERDHKDSSRDFAPLRKANDAIEIQTDHLSIDEVTAKIVSLYREKLSGR
jgi:pantoate ligase / CMP/dCMP kinase